MVDNVFLELLCGREGVVRRSEHLSIIARSMLFRPCFLYGRSGSRIFIAGVVAHFIEWVVVDLKVREGFKRDQLRSLHLTSERRPSEVRY